MKHLLPTLLRFFSQKRTLSSCVLGALIICFFTLAPSTASAADVVSEVFRWVGGVTIGAVTSPIAILMWVVFKISTVILGIAGIMFNWAVLVVVFEFSKYLGNSPGMTLAWGILRDFGNIGLIFGFVFMGITTILDLHAYSWKKTLPKLVIAAVLLNFSLFIAEAIVDTTNVLAATLYDTTYGAAQQCTSANWIGCGINTGLAGVILEKITITTAFNQTTIGELTANIVAQASTPIENIMKFVLLALVASVAATVLFAGASMLISRGVVLAFLLVTSPIGIAGSAIPQLEGLAKDWWKKLIDQALFAPVFILLLLVSLKMTDGLAQLVGPGGLAAALNLTDVGNTTGTLLFFALIMGFMVGSLMMAQRFGIYGADLAIKTAAGAVYGTMGFIGRNTLGRYSANLANRIQTSGRGTTFLNKRLLGVAQYGAKSSYSGRGIVGGATKKIAKVDFGKVGDAAGKGFIGETEASNKKKNEMAKARSDAWGAQDKEFKTKGENLKREEETALAKAEEAERNGNFNEARIQGEAAERARLAGEQNQRDAKDAERARMTEDERLVEDYRNTRASSAEEAEAATVEPLEQATNNLAAATTNLTNAANTLAETQGRVAELERERTLGGGRNTAEIENDLRFATERQRVAHEAHSIAEEEAETAHIRREAAERENQTARENREALRKRADDYAKEVRDPKHAMEQMAQSFERMANARLGAIPVGQFLDPQRLRAGAAAVRKDKGQTDIQKALHAIEHELHAVHNEPHDTPEAPHAGAGGAPGPAHADH